VVSPQTTVRAGAHVLDLRKLMAALLRNLEKKMLDTYEFILLQIVGHALARNNGE
jgi:hypothetical protein